MFSATLGGVFWNYPWVKLIDSAPCQRDDVSGSFVLNSSVSFCSLTLNLFRMTEPGWLRNRLKTVIRELRRFQSSVVPELQESPDCSSEAGHPDAYESACGIHSLSGPRSPLMAPVMGVMLGLALGHALGESVNDCRNLSRQAFSVSIEQSVDYCVHNVCRLKQCNPNGNKFLSMLTGQLLRLLRPQNSLASPEK